MKKWRYNKADWISFNIFSNSKTIYNGKKYKSFRNSAGSIYQRDCFVNSTRKEIEIFSAKMWNENENL